jgi:hypothetical protein
MRLVDFPVEVLAQVFDLLKPSHLARLYWTGEEALQRLVLLGNRNIRMFLYDKQYSSLARLLLESASVVSTDESFLAHLTNASGSPAPSSLKSSPKVRQLEITFTHGSKYANMDFTGPVVLTDLTSLESFSHVRPMSYSGKYYLPKSVTHVRVLTTLADPIDNLGSLSNLFSLSLSFSNVTSQTTFMKNVVWPKSVEKLALHLSEMGEMVALPSTLTALTLSGHFGTTVRGVPEHCNLVTSLEMSFPILRLAADAHYPSCLTRLQLNGAIDISVNFDSLPSHVTDLSFLPFDESAVDVGAITETYRSLLPRLTSLSNVNKAARACLGLLRRTSNAELTELINTRFAQFGLDHRYLSLMLNLKRFTLSGRLPNAYHAKLPDHYIKAFLLDRQDYFQRVPAESHYDDSKEESDFLEWAFKLPGVDTLELKFRGGSNPLPQSVCDTVRTLILDLAWTTSSLDVLLSSSWPRLESFVVRRDAKTPPTTDVIRVLHEKRHNLLRLESVSFGSDCDLFDQDSLRLLGEMRLYETDTFRRALYRVSSPRHHEAE